MDLKVLRGQKLLDQLDQLEEDSTYNQLHGNIVRGFPGTRKRQHTTGSVHIVTMEYLPYVNNGALRVDTVAKSSGNTYQPTVVFRDVMFQDEDLPTNTTFRATDNNEYHIQTIRLAGSNVRVRCNCLDFHYRFGAWNHGDSSLEGPPPPTHRPTSDRPPVNPTRVPGVCKHIIKVVQQLRQGRVVT